MLNVCKIFRPLVKKNAIRRFFPVGKGGGAGMPFLGLFFISSFLLIPEVTYLMEKMEDDLVDAVRQEALNAANELNAFYRALPVENRAQAYREILAIFDPDRGVSLNQALDVNTPEVVPLRERIVGYEALLLWLGLTLLLFLFTQYGLSVWDWARDVFGGVPSLLMQAMDPDNVERLLHNAATTTPERRLELINLARRVARPNAA